MNQFNLYSILSELQQAQSIHELTLYLKKNLKYQMDISSADIYFNDNNSKHESSHFVFYSFNLENMTKIKIFFDRGIKFTKPELIFLKDVSDAVKTNLDRLLKIEFTDYLKQQWDSTFDAIATPLCLTNENYEIVRSNKFFTASINVSESLVIGKNVFKIFLGLTDISFKIDKDKNNFSAIVQKKIDSKINDIEVQCQLISQPQKQSQISPKQYLIVFKDITEQKKIEKQIFKSAKMADLGTIGSSIAHELNNPISGMLSFIQIIKMDLKKDSPILDTINKMEMATLKCKDIVENLLGFSKKHDINEFEKIDLKNIIAQSIQLIEIQTKSKGIKFNYFFDKDKEFTTLGNENLLSQAIGRLIQEASINLKNCQNLHPDLTPIIDLHLSGGTNGPILSIKDNRILPESFDSFKSEQSFGVTVAYKIMKDHDVVMEFFSQSNMGVQVNLSFKRPDLLDERQVFDVEI